MEDLVCGPSGGFSTPIMHIRIITYVWKRVWCKWKRNYSISINGAVSIGVLHHSALMSNRSQKNQEEHTLAEMAPCRLTSFVRPWISPRRLVISLV